jgi:hypothetical protein
MAFNLDNDLIKGKISSVISEQLPEFVQSDHPTFITFLDAYYEWLEQHGNAVEVTRNARIYNDIDLTVDVFVDYFKKNYLVDIPDTITNDKRTLLKNIKNFYQAKGTDKSIILLFRMLFNEEVSIYYPKKDMLRVSDGQFSTDIILNIKSVTGPITDIVGGSVIQSNNPSQSTINLASGGIENFIGLQVGTDTVYQLSLTQNSVNGTFVAEQPVNISTINGTVTGIIDEIITNVNITNPGAYFTAGDSLLTKNVTPNILLETGDNILTETSNTLITEEIGTAAAFDITSVGKGEVDNFLIETKGKGYALDDIVTYTNSGQGSGASAKVSRVEGRLIKENDGDGIMLENGHAILAGNIVEFVKEDGDNLLLETGSKVIPEIADFTGEVHEILIINKGNNYDQLPTVAITSTNGTGASIFSTSDSVGRITGIARTNLGSGYTQAPLVTSDTNIILEDITGTFVAGEPITSQPYRQLKEDGSSIKLETGDLLISENSVVEDGVLTSFDTTRSLYKVKPNSAIDKFSTPSRRGRVTGGTSGATATIFQSKPATITPITGTLSTSEGVLTGADGRISESSKSIQDSKYFQDFSYVVKVGNSINIWRDAVKRILHPVGLALFGEVSIQTSVRANVWGGSNVRLNGSDPRFKQILQLINISRNVLMTPREQKIELEIFIETVKTTMFPTRIHKEDGSAILMEDSNEVMTNKGNQYLLGEESINGTEKGAGLLPTLIFPRSPTPMTNIDATMTFLKEIILLLKTPAFDAKQSIPTVDGTLTHGKTKATPEILLILETFEAFVNELTATSTVKHEIQIFKQLSQVAQAVQRAVVLLLPTITSSDDLKVAASSKLHLIASLGLEDAMLHESYGSARLGSTGYSIDRFKFLFPPYSAGFREIDRGGRIYRATYNSAKLTANYSGSNTSNDNYWDTYANTNILHLSEFLTADDLANYPGRKTPLVFDSEIFLRSS